MDEQLRELLIRWIYVQHPGEVFECTDSDVWANYHEGVGACGSELALKTNLKEFFGERV